MTLSTQPRIRKILTAAAVLFFINILISIFLAYEYYAPDPNSICAINATFDCISVSKTDFGTFLWIPVAVWGIVFYAGLFLGAAGLLLKTPFEKIHKKLTQRNVFKIVVYFTYFGLLFSLYLTFVEAFVIHKYCAFCLAQQAVVLIAAVILTWANSVWRKKRP